MLNLALQIKSLDMIVVLVYGHLYSFGRDCHLGVSGTLLCLGVLGREGVFGNRTEEFEAGEKRDYHMCLPSPPLLVSCCLNEFYMG